MVPASWQRRNTPLLAAGSTQNSSSRSKSAKLSSLTRKLAAVLRSARAARSSTRQLASPTTCQPERSEPLNNVRQPSSSTSSPRPPQAVRRTSVSALATTLAPRLKGVRTNRECCSMSSGPARTALTARPDIGVLIDRQVLAPLGAVPHARHVHRIAALDGLRQEPRITGGVLATQLPRLRIEPEAFDHVQLFAVRQRPGQHARRETDGVDDQHVTVPA